MTRERAEQTLTQIEQALRGRMRKHRDDQHQNRSISRYTLSLRIRRTLTVLALVAIGIGLMSPYVFAPPLSGT